MLFAIALFVALCTFLSVGTLFLVIRETIRFARLIRNND